MRLRYVEDQAETITRFVAAMIPHVGYRGFNNCKTIGIVNEDGELIAGFVYNNWNPMSGIIEMNGAALPGHHWLTRETIRRAFTYPFDVVGCQMVLMRVLATNERLLRQLASGGFVFVKVPRLFGRHHDGVIATFTYEDWASSRFNKKTEPRIVKPERHPLDAPDFLRRTKEAA